MGSLILHAFQSPTPRRRSSRCSGLATSFGPHSTTERGQAELDQHGKRTLLAPLRRKRGSGSGCDARRLSTGRSIRAWRILCGRQMTRNAERMLASEALVPWLGGPRSRWLSKSLLRSRRRVGRIAARGVPRRPFSLRQRRERAAKARRNRWVSSERLSHHGIMRSLPLRTFSQRRALRYSGWQPTRACFFRPKACQYPRFMGRRASSSRISSRHVPEPCTSREPEGRRSCDIPRRGPRRALGSRLAVRLKIRVISGLMTGADEAGHGAPDLLDLRDCLEIHGEGEVAEAIASLRHMSDARPSEVVRQYGDAVGGQHVEHPNAALRRLRLNRYRKQNACADAPAAAPDDGLSRQYSRADARCDRS